jgi:hypothetical protein
MQPYPMLSMHGPVGVLTSPPDPTAIRLLEVPDPAPPYDDAVAAGDPVLATPARTAIGQQRRNDTTPKIPAAARQLAGWPGQFAQVLAETLAGSRPAEQLRPWTTEQARRRIRQLGPALSTGQRPKVRKIMTSAPTQDILEMTAVVHFGARTRVLALRLERAQPPGRPGCSTRAAPQQWLCTAIESA